MVLVGRGAALCIEEKDLTADRLWEAICQVTAQPEKLEEMSRNVRDAAILDADVRIMNELTNLLKK